jgi:hypothetical protein
VRRGQGHHDHRRQVASPQFGPHESGVAGPPQQPVHRTQIAVHGVDVDRAHFAGKRHYDVVVGERVDGRLKGGDEIAPRVRGLRRRGGLDLGGEHVLEDRANELVAVAEAAVDGRDANTRPARDLRKGHGGTDILERTARGDHDALVVAGRVDP